MINVNSTKDIRLAFGGRYFLVKDSTNGMIRVVSVHKMRELQPYIAADGGWRYKFATSVGGYQNLWDQAWLNSRFATNESCGRLNGSRPAAGPLLEKLLASLEVRVATIEETTSIMTGVKTVTTNVSTFTGGYVVGSVSSNGISFSSNPKVHTTSKSAEAEAERLASTNAGKEFVVFKATMSAMKANVVTRSF